MIRNVGGYELERHLGGGGQGNVFLGRDKSSGEQAAVKLLSLGFTDEDAFITRTRVNREVSALRVLRSPYVVRVFGSGDLPDVSAAHPFGFMYVAYEFVEGPTLREWLKSNATPLHLALRILKLVGEGLQAAHTLGLIHRDIKPENILLRDGNPNHPVIIDFGSVQGSLSHTIVTTAFLPGTYFYMAPELRDGGVRATPLSDQWSFGKVAAEILCQSFTGQSQQEDDGSDDLLTILAEYSPSIAITLKQALARSPSDRFPSVDALATALCAGNVPEALSYTGSEQPQSDQPDERNSDEISILSGVASYLLGVEVVVERRNETVFMTPTIDGNTGPSLTIWPNGKAPKVSRRAGVILGSEGVIDRAKSALYADASLSQWIWEHRDEIELIPNWVVSEENLLGKHIPWTEYPQQLADWLALEMMEGATVAIASKNEISDAAYHRLEYGDTTAIAALIPLWRLLTVHKADPSGAPF